MCVASVSSLCPSQYGDLAMEDPRSPSFVRACIQQSNISSRSIYLFVVGRTARNQAVPSDRSPGGGPLFRFQDGRLGPPGGPCLDLDF